MPQHANTVPFSLSLDLGKVACFQVPALTFPQSRTVTPVGSPQASFSLKWRGVVVQYFIKTTEWNKNTRSLLSSVFFSCLFLVENMGGRAPTSDSNLPRVCMCQTYPVVLVRHGWMFSINDTAIKLFEAWD